MLADIWDSHEKLRFLAVGAWNTVFAYAAYLTLYALFERHLSYLVMNVLVHSCAVTNAFVCQRFFVFQSRAPWFTAFLRFNAVQLLVLIWSLAGLFVMVALLHFRPFYSQLFIMTVSVVGGYLLNRGYAFKS